MGKRQRYSAAFKALVAIAAIKEQETLSELSRRFGIHPQIISNWKREQVLYEKTGRLKMEVRVLWRLFHTLCADSAYNTLISMDGKGRALDNIWIERFWRTIKYEYIYLNPADNGTVLSKGILKNILTGLKTGSIIDYVM